MNDIACPRCGETEDLQGERAEKEIMLECGRCASTWRRSLERSCSVCGGSDLEAVPMAIVERSRGTQLSIVGTRTVYLCYRCDAAALAKFHKNRPNPLMPDELPTVNPQDA